jgi:hypothetical protein
LRTQRSIAYFTGNLGVPKAIAVVRWANSESCAGAMVNASLCRPSRVARQLLGRELPKKASNPRELEIPDMQHGPRSLAIVLALGLVTGCANKPASEPADKGSPSSPDLKEKDQTKNPGGTSSPGAMQSGTVSPMETGPKSPDIAAKDATKSPAAPPNGGVSMAPVMGPAYKDATHVLADNEPYYLSSPGTEAKPDGMWAAGTPVLVVIPSGTYSKVKTGGGTEAYVSTAGLKPK